VTTVKSRNDTTLVRWTRAGTVGLALSAGLLAVAGCGQRSAPGNPAVEEARAQLTAAAIGSPAVGTPAAPSTGEAVIRDILGTPLAAGTTDSGAAIAATRLASDATAGIPNVRPLVQQQAPLATFTPAPNAPKLTGQVLYVRGGRFFTVPAAGGAATEVKLANADMPAIWSPADDPGRAWAAPDGQHVAFFAGPDAEMWIMQTDGQANARVAPANLPSGIRDVTVTGAAPQPVRFRPKVQYTLVYGAGGKEPLAVLVDNNDRHVKGQGRVRVVHAAPGAADKQLVAYVNGTALGAPMTLGRSSGDVPALAGQLQVEIKDAQGKSVLQLAPIDLAERELKTIFITGKDKLEGVQYTYPVVTDAQSTASMVRAFNAGDKPIDAAIGDISLAKSLAPNQLSSYANVPAAVSSDARRDLELSVYGLKPMEAPVSWSPDGRQVAWLGAPNGQLQVFVSAPGGPARQLTDDGTTKLNPVWSPDGAALAWVEADPNYNDQTIAFWKDGKVGRVDMAAVKKAEGLESTAPMHFPGDVEWIDGTRLYMYPVSSKVPAGIWVYDTAGDQLTQVSKEPVASPDWSPTAKAWAFGRQQGSGELFVLPLGGKMKQLPVKGRYPQWLPDGQRLSWVEGAPDATDGWAIHVINADGTGDQALTEKAALIQSDPSVPGPNPKRYWLQDGRVLGFTKAGTDYGAREEAGFTKSEAGNDIENLWLVPTDGSAPPKLASDLSKIFYLKELAESPAKDALAFIAFAYDSRTQQLYALPAAGGKPVQLDSGVRWFQWLP
jgi:Tol biopolymer transport system component